MVCKGNRMGKNNSPKSLYQESDSTSYLKKKVVHQSNEHFKGTNSIITNFKPLASKK